MYKKKRVTSYGSSRRNYLSAYTLPEKASGAMILSPLLTKSECLVPTETSLPIRRTVECYANTHHHNWQPYFYYFGPNSERLIVWLLRLFRNRGMNSLAARSTISGNEKRFLGEDLSRPSLAGKYLWRF